MTKLQIGFKFDGKLKWFEYTFSALKINGICVPESLSPHFLKSVCLRSPEMRRDTRLQFSVNKKWGKIERHSLKE